MKWVSLVLEQVDLAGQLVGNNFVNGNCGACKSCCSAGQALAAAKGAISSMALSAASTYSPHNIRVNVVVPGVIEAKMTKQLVDNEQARP